MWARTPYADRGFDTLAQPVGWRFARQVLAHQPLKGRDALALGGNCRIGRHTLLHFKGVRRMLAIQIDMDRQRGFFVDHRAADESLLPMVLITWFRSRARRDIMLRRQCREPTYSHLRWINPFALPTDNAKHSPDYEDVMSLRELSRLNVVSYGHQRHIPSSVARRSLAGPHDRYVVGSSRLEGRNRPTGGSDELCHT
jgi:hypothetical protein